MSAKQIVAVLGRPIPPESEEHAMLTAAGADLRSITERTEDAIIAGAQGAVAMFNFGQATITRRVFAGLPDLRFFIQCSIGYDRVDVGAATEHGVMVANNPLAWREEVADQAAMFILACTRRLSQQILATHEYGWDRQPIADAIRQIRRVRGQTLGFIGFGQIARRTAEKLRGFEFRYLAADPYVTADLAASYGATLVSLEELCRESDFISMHALLNDQTRHLLREEHFRLMKPTAHFINTSRGATVDEAALIKALRGGWIAGAALDVLEVEPPAPDNPLLNMPNVIVTCHTAGQAVEAQRDNLRQTTEEMIRFLSGEQPRALVNPEVKERLAERLIAR